MLDLIHGVVSQMGPMRPPMYQDSTGLLLALMFIFVAGFAMMLMLFPRLEGVRPSGSIRPEVERFEEEHVVERPEEHVEAVGNHAIDVALRLLEPDERRVVEALVGAGGTMLQKDVSYELGFTRVKTHRVMVKLLRRGVVTAEKYYNTNRIQIADWLKPGQRP